MPLFEKLNHVYTTIFSPRNGGIILIIYLSFLYGLFFHFFEPVGLCCVIILCQGNRKSQEDYVKSQVYYLSGMLLKALCKCQKIILKLWQIENKINYPQSKNVLLVNF